MGVRLLWNKGQPISTTISWNPFATNIPWKTLTNHPLHGYEGMYYYKLNDKIKNDLNFFFNF